MKLNKEEFGIYEGEKVWLYTLGNDRGMVVKATTYGGIITSLVVPDRRGNPRDVVLGFDNLEGYLQGHPYFGAIVGRFANRIGGGEFTLNGKVYHLARNDGENHLHGGVRGFDKVLWTPATAMGEGRVSLILKYLSADGEEGYPGNLAVTVTYTLDNNNNLEIEYTAETDKPTIVNLTHHDYFNLADPARDILDHEARIESAEYLEEDALVPTGNILRVEGTPYDFRKFKTFGRDLAETGIGYDNCFVLKNRGYTPALSAVVHSPVSGITLEVRTTAPGLQLYTANYLDGTITGKKGIAYPQYGAFCLEAQHFPDAPHHPAFPSTVLNPGETYFQKTVFSLYSRD